MDKKQIAHDLAVARLAGKQLPADVLVAEYQKSYDEIFKYLQALPPAKTRIGSKDKLGL